MLPGCDNDDTPAEQYFVNTSWGRHMVSAYTGLTFHQVGQLDYVTYLQWLRDSYIYALNQTTEGQEQLREAWRLQQTAPDRSAIRRFKKRGADRGR